jgi:hypothetical protein
MREKTLFFLYSVAQYVHWRRDERLNVGVVIYDPIRRWVNPYMDTGYAVRRVRAAFPEVDRVGLQIALQDLARTLPHEEVIEKGIEEGRPLEDLSLWQNMIRFTPPKAFPASSMSAALGRLRAIFLDDPFRTAERPVKASVLWAKRRTNEAIEAVLNPVYGFGLERDIELPGTTPLPLRFPFLVLGKDLIDSLAFESETAERSQAFAHHFMKKVEEVRNIPGDYRVHATVAVNRDRPEGGRALIRYVLHETKLPSWSVVEAENAEFMVEHIRDCHRTAQAK